MRAAAASPRSRFRRQAQHLRNTSRHLASQQPKASVLLRILAQSYCEQLSLTIFKCVTAI